MAVGVGAFAITANAAQPAVEFVPGEYIVKLKDNVNLQNKALASELNAFGANVVLKNQNIIKVNRSLVENSTFAMNEIAQSPFVEYVEPNYIYKINRTPNDPKLSELWGLINVNSAGEEGADIDAEKAWDIQTGSKNVVVAVIDTGVDYNIDDLQENMWVNEAELNGKPGVDDDGNGFVDDIHGYDFANSDADPRDDHGHGSHCSGTIGAKGNDGKGIVGVNWDVRIMALKFLTASGSGTLEHALKSIDYATQNGANIMSNSWGGGGFSQALEDAIKRASDAGILFVAAAGNHRGNNDQQPTYPANYAVPNVVSVAAIDESGELASFSCFGQNTVHVAAPGVGVLSTTPDGYKSWSGTSMATPHVSGVAALLLANEPNLTPTEIKDRLIKTARPLSSLRGKVVSAGVVNAYYALENQQAPIDPNDPYYWSKQSESAETEHPYTHNAKKEWVFKVEGAAKVAVHFTGFNTERGYDKVTIYDAAGNSVKVYSGELGDFYTSTVNGDTVRVEFVSDASVSKDGFRIDHVSFVE